MHREVFGTLPTGETVERFTLAVPGGPRVRVLTYGAIVQSIETPDATGLSADVVLGHDSLGGYLRGDAHLGALIGRYANRIAGGRFTLDGREYRVPRNNGPNTLHGGDRGFDRRMWTAEPGGDDSLALYYVSPDGEEGFPGTLRTEVVYTVTPDGGLRMEYQAITDAPTVVNLTDHSYFNLSGAGAGEVLGNVLTIDADHYLPVDATQIPVGDPAPVAGTPFDFTTPHAVGERIGAGGYDHCWVLNPGDGVKARVEDPASGRVLEVLTTEPGLQFYTADHLDRRADGYGPHAALCLETQHFPDSPNRPSFPSTVLRPGERFRSATVYRFSTAS
ncbi:aldose epimerase family protein [Spongiactinospora sp. TRM90649]|uniref:aldose epimerase family protein n=1 Tax=Spongiactinospora sp. TRM90649 TaxID=3031114 RepID=UPI0023F7FFD3|nr:aldose epimerase family protein [Spongiactinospora sp. TRM90649]MDF5754017.1 galactose mutarotase [Spongiactinospora sp. TRM90649]